MASGSATFVSRPLRLLSLLILAFQVYIPWSVKHLVTQDGPSHVYNAFVTEDLVFHRHTSPYHAVYRVQKTVLPNWTCTILLAGFLGAFGPDCAEAFLMTLCLLTGYCSLAYGMRSIAPGARVPLLFANWLAQSWFLWSGFYNFSLGMALLPLLIGFYVRHEREFTWRRAAVLAGGSVGLFFTHLIPALLGGLAVTLLALWLRRGWRSLGLVAASLSPLALLALLYVMQFPKAAPFQPDVHDALLRFPEKIFQFALGWRGEQRWIWPVIVFAIVASLGLMKKKEWRSAPGGLALSAFGAFVLYLLLPDVGLGGSVVKMRFALAVFVLGSMLVASVERLSGALPAIEVWVAVLLVAQLLVIAGQVGATSDAVGEYLAAMDKLPPGSRFVRLNEPAPAAKDRFAMTHFAFTPLLHVAALGAVHRHAVDLSDYQAATRTFSVAFKREIDEGKATSLWGLESPDENTWASLDWLRGSLPITIEYAVLFGDEIPRQLASRATLVDEAAGTPFVRVFRF